MNFGGLKLVRRFSLQSKVCAGLAKLLGLQYGRWDLPICAGPQRPTAWAPLRRCRPSAAPAIHTAAAARNRNKEGPHSRTCSLQYTAQRSRDTNFGFGKNFVIMVQLLTLCK